MKYRLIAASAAFAIAAVALAGLITIWSVNGHGTVSNGERTGSFSVEAQRVLRSGSTTAAVRGRFLLDFSTSTQRGNRLNISVRHYELGTAPNAVRISGPAVYTFMEGGVWREVVGTGWALLVSNRHPEEPGDPDRLEVHFESANHPVVFNFGGHVTAGDITVAKTESY
jgi:hypothetical protein